MKKITILLATVLALSGFSCLNAQTKDLLADLNILQSGDTIKIVHNNDTTTIVSGTKSLDFDTLIVIGNDSAILNGVISKSFKLNVEPNSTNIEKFNTDEWLKALSESFFKDFNSNDYNQETKTKEKESEYAKETTYSCNSNKTYITGDLVIGYGMLGWDNKKFNLGSPDGAYSLKWSSRWDIIAMIKILPDYRFSVSTGIGYESDIFRFDNTNDFYTLHPQFANAGTEKTKMVARYITVPLLLNYKIKSNIKLHAGVIGGLNFRTSHTGIKLQYENSFGNKIEESTGSSYNAFRPLKLDAMFGVKFYGFTIYCRQSLTKMFKNGREAELYPFSFGLMIGL